MGWTADTLLSIDVWLVRCLGNEEMFYSFECISKCMSERNIAESSDKFILKYCFVNARRNQVCRSNSSN